MLVALDLTARQAARVLTQALKTRAKLEIDPRPEFMDSPLWGTLANREQDTLLVHVLDAGQNVALPTLIGAMCDVRTILSEQLYMFSTMIVDASTGTAPRHISLAVPDVIQVANRRRFARRSPIEPIPVRLTVPGAAQPFVGNLANISRNGLACRAPRRELEDLLLIGDEIGLEFALPWANQLYALGATVCIKTPGTDQDHFTVGFEFVANDAAARATLELLRAALDGETQRLTEMDGNNQ